MQNSRQQFDVFDKETRNFFHFSGVNILFGYSKSGKTSTISKLVSIFSGKEKQFLVNGVQAMPNDFNIISIVSGDGIVPHLKLNSKSLLRKLLEQDEVKNKVQSSLEVVQSEFERLQEQLQLSISQILPEATVEISNLAKPMSILIDNVSIEIGDDSSSSNRKELFSIACRLAESSKAKTLIFIDDFASSFDEEATMAFFEQVKATNATFFLSSSKPIPQFLIDDDTSIFAVRSSKLKTLPKLQNLVVSGITKTSEFQTYEEYMLSSGYMNGSKILDLFLDQMRADMNSNILRILCAKSPIIAASPVAGKVTIIPRSSNEQDVYASVFELLGIPLQDDQLVSRGL